MAPVGRVWLGAVGLYGVQGCLSGLRGVAYGRTGKGDWPQ